jgi:3-hydroxyacyl-[acyl-carrier-protein] dehydratase
LLGGSARTDRKGGIDLSAMDIQKVLSLLPHRYPFLLIDKVLECEPGKRLLGVKNVTYNEPYFTGHFPVKPVMPGVLIIEAMAQTAAVLVVETLEGAAAGKLVYFMTVEHGRFRKPVFPGDRLEVLVSKERNRGNVWKFRGEARVEGTLMAEATFSAMIMDD